MKKEIPIWRNTSLENLPDEEWRDVTGFEGMYQVSNYSRIKSLNRIDCRGQRRPEKILLQNFDSDGYLILVICKEGINYTKKPHRLSAIEFLPNPLFLPEVNHLDTDKTNNHISNLEWSTTKNNAIHAEQMGVRRKINGENNYGAILTSDKVLEIFNSKKSIKELSKIFGVGELAIGRIKHGKTWRSITGAIYIKKRDPKLWLKN